MATPAEVVEAFTPAEFAHEDTRGFLRRYVFSDVIETPVVKNKHGDSSGVRGAAWLWPSA